MTKLVCICAWCKDKQEKERKYKAKWYTVSHGLCKKCEKLYFNK